MTHKVQTAYESSKLTKKLQFFNLIVIKQYQLTGIQKLPEYRCKEE
jgi:hypothetical protein